MFNNTDTITHEKCLINFPREEQAVSAFEGASSATVLSYNISKFRKDLLQDDESKQSRWEVNVLKDDW